MSSQPSFVPELQYRLYDVCKRGQTKKWEKKKSSFAAGTYIYTHTAYVIVIWGLCVLSVCLCVFFHSIVDVVVIAIYIQFAFKFDSQQLSVGGRLFGYIFFISRESKGMLQNSKSSNRREENQKESSPL